MSGYRIDKNTHKWELIGRGDPQKPQMFYPTNKEIPISQGDWVAARCTMYNYRDHYVPIGSTGADEMCNFYIMYYINRMDATLTDDYCATAGPPYYYWKHNLKVPKEIDSGASERLAM